MYASYKSFRTARFRLPCVACTSFSLLLCSTILRANELVPEEIYHVESGTVRIQFDQRTLQTLDMSLAVIDTQGEVANSTSAILDIQDSSTFSAIMPSDTTKDFRVGGIVYTTGGFMVSQHGQRRHVFRELQFKFQHNRPWIVTGRKANANSPIKLELAEPSINIDFMTRRIVIEATLRIQDANINQNEPTSSYPLGRVIIEGFLSNDKSCLEWTETITPKRLQLDGQNDELIVAASGPDIIVRSIFDVKSFGQSLLSDVSAFSIGTISCNQGDVPANWFGFNNQHPVIAQNLFRMKDGRFEQIGMSWLKHGFLATTGDSCNLGCTPPPAGNDQLGIGCSDPYSASLNGQQSNLGPRSDVNPVTGWFIFPWSAPSPEPTVGRRLQAHNADLDPALNSGALYFVDVQYISSDDAAAGLNVNNSSYRRATVTQPSIDFQLNLTAATSPLSPGIKAWRHHDSSVVEATIDVTGDGRFIASAKTVQLAGGFWSYEYAVYNMNSDRSAGTFSVPLQPGASVRNIGFHDVDYHSGEPYDGTDWSDVVGTDSISWATEPESQNINANAIRWGTMYNFRFEANVAPNPLPVTIGLFKGGAPASIEGLLVAPALPPPLCGDDIVEGDETCEPPDGVLCDANCQTITNDPIRGGQLWDQWWLINGSPSPAGDHPMYPAVGQQSGANTFRCNECHGWDYKGDDGAYGSGSHFTGIAGVWGSTMSAAEMFDIIQRDDLLNGHNFRNIGLSDQDARDLVQFILDLTIDTDNYIGIDSAFMGDPVAGEINYTTAGTTSCITCHGAEGTTINFGTPEEPEWVGTIAAQNPWELMHKIRFGQPNSPMPSWLADGGSDQGAADIGAYAQAMFPEMCLNNGHCDDGLFCNGMETCLDGQCLMGSDPCPQQPCDDTNDVCGVADARHGGLLWDKWWAELGLNTPTGQHVLYPAGGPHTGDETFRCATCHGWDYKGVDGEYSSGPNFTGIPGVFDSQLSSLSLFQIIQSDSVTDGHGYGNLGLSENDIWDLVEFIETLMIDTDPYVFFTGDFFGDPANGLIEYETGGSTSCIVCHGPDGTDLDFGSGSTREWIGTVAVYDPLRLLHKIRIGNAGGPMPGWLAGGGTDQSAADIGRYAQLNFPVDCTLDSHCDDGLFCNGAETCVSRFCVAGTDPCPGEFCEESIDVCISGNCPDPIASGVGSRHVRIDPAAIAQPVAFRVDGGTNDPNVFCLSAYLQIDGSLGALPAFQLPDDWGTIFVRDESISPNSTYTVRADCGDAVTADYSFAQSATTNLWGDVDSNSIVNAADILTVVKGFQLDFTLATLEEMDLEPCVPNGIINSADILQAVKAFQLVQFSAMSCQQVCP
ncbi:cytochrome c [bacterium AH-315-J04]|nr:cytochrome c [bacterium AH-315-J04]